MISEEIGDYTTMSNSESNSYNGTRLFDMTGANISASRNLMGRRLLKPEELSLIERPGSVDSWLKTGNNARI